MMVAAQSARRTSPPGWLPWTVGAAGLAAALSAYAFALTSDHLDQRLAQGSIHGWITLSYVLCGLIVWRRQPTSRFGPLMIAAGFAKALSNLTWSDDPVVQSIGMVFDLLPLVVFIHLFLAFPTGRLRSRADRALVTTAYAIAVGGQVVVMLLGTFGEDNAFAVVDAPAAGNIIHAVMLVSIATLSLTGMAVLLVRRRRWGRARRRSAELLLDAFLLGLLMIALLLLWGFPPLPYFAVVQRSTLVVLGLAPIAFLIALLDSHLARSGVGDLVIRLRAAPADLRDALAQALRDPSLTLLYWLPQYRTWADEKGRPAELPTDERRAATVIDRDGEPVAALVHDPSLRDEPALLDAVSAAAAIALDNGRLKADLHARIEEVRGSRARVIEAEHRERQRLERDLHDGAQQRLIALSLDLGRLEGRLGADPDARAALVQAKREVATSLDELRTVARGLHPAVLSGHGLAVAVESLAARSTVPVTLHIGLEQRLPETVEVAAYYVVSESLANIGKHAEATSARVDLTYADDTLVVEVVDDGVGGADADRGTGLRGLADRVEATGGRLQVWTPRGAGTRVRAELPCG
jgi:signal transduction histidine kinase